jgi:membrane protease YdiL (CAAX protease family)
VTPAKRRPSGRSSSAKKDSSVAPTSRTNAGPKPKGRVPTAAPGAKGGSRRRQEDTSAKGTKGAKGAKGSGGEGATTKGDPVAVPEVVDGAPAGKKPYGAGALLFAFLVAQVLSTIAYVIAQSSSDYDFTVPTGVGAAVGQAASQAGSGQPLVISVPPPLWLTALLQLPLWLGLGAIPVWFAVKRGRGVVADLGLRMKAVDVPVGLAVGVACQLLMVPALYWVIFKVIGVKDVSAAARALTDRATDPLSIVLVFLVVAIGAPLAEEIYFRGFAQRIFARKVAPHWAIVCSAAFFGMSHLQVLQFPALFLFGLVLGYMAWRFGRLGPAIWAHVGFNTVTAIGLVFHLG